MATCEDCSDKSKSAWVLERHLQEEEQVLVPKFRNLGLQSNEDGANIDERDESSAADGSRFHPRIPYAEDSSFFLQIGECNFGLSCRFNHPVKKTNLVDQGTGTEKGSEGISEMSSEITCKGEKNCPFYMRTGSSRYEACCRFHHPDPYISTLNGEFVGYFNEDSDIIDNEYLPLHFSGPSSAQTSWSSPLTIHNCAPDQDNPEGLHQNPEWTGYQLYLTAGGCKYGESCRFNHSKEESEIAPTELNFLGLPIRLGEKDCPFYMRTGSCGYGACCRYHHLDPTSVGGSDPCSSTLNDKYAGYYDCTSDIIDNEEYLPLLFSGPSFAQASWWHLITNKVIPTLSCEAPLAHPITINLFQELMK